MEISTAALNSVKKGFQKLFDKAYQGIPDPWFLQLAMESSSTGAEEEYHWLGAIPGMEELLGEVTLKNLVRHGWTIKNKEWHDTIPVKRVDIQRDKLGVYTPLVTTMGEAARMHPGELVAKLLSEGFASKDYTGKNFFDTDKKAHAKAVKFTNKDTHVLAASTFETARANLKGRLNAEGRAMRLGADLVLVVPPALEAKAREILIADTIPNAEGTASQTNVNKGTARPLVIPELASYSDTAWFLIEAGKQIKPVIVQTELQPSTNMVTNDNDSHVLLKGEYLYQAYGRYNVGYGLPEFAYGSTGADALA
ncbi:MAG TPA: Mu-like prophage major head subunit gpT family protein [Chthoniobacterales bacterium]